MSSTSTFHDSSSTSSGSRHVVRTSGASIVLPPRVSGMNCLEKFRRASINSIMLSSSPSAFLLFPACQKGCARPILAGVKPIIRPMMPAEVCGARPMTSCPTSCSFVFML